MNELTMNLKTDSKVPLYEQIYNYIKSDIQNGRISYGEKLPSTRALARHLEISRSTAELAYEQLLSEGYIESEPCRGYFVAKIDELYQIRPAKTPTEEKKEQKPRYRYDFTPNGVDLKSFPYNAWRKLSKDILTDDKLNYYIKILERVANREATPQFFNKLPGVEEQYYLGRNEVSNQDFLGIVTDYNDKTRTVTITERNYFKTGDQVEVFGPNIKPFTFTVPDIYNSAGEKVNIARHPEEILTFKLDKKVYKNDIIRAKIS